jgi:hypothetical protein
MSSCTFVPLSKYDWSLHPALIPVALPWNPTVYCLIAAFCGISLWMTIELTLQIFFTFKRHKSLYFWALLVCTWGIAFHVLGLILKLFNEGNWIISSIVSSSLQWPRISLDSVIILTCSSDIQNRLGQQCHWFLVGALLSPQSGGTESEAP